MDKTDFIGHICLYGYQEETSLKKKPKRKIQTMLLCYYVEKSN